MILVRRVCDQSTVRMRGRGETAKGRAHSDGKLSTPIRRAATQAVTKASSGVDSGAPQPKGNIVSWSRPIDIWFSTQVLPHEAHFLRQGRRWSRNNEEAFDLVQEAYLKLLQMDDWPAIRDPRSYTVTMIRNLVLQRVRRDQVVAITDIPAPGLAEIRDEAPGVFETVAAREALLALLADVERLPPVCQRVIRMRKFEDRTPTEIAHALGIGVSTVETHLARGMQQLVRWRRASQSPVPPCEVAAPDEMVREELRA